MDDRNLALDLVRVTEATAVAAAREMGRGDPYRADYVAVAAMREAFDRVDIRGTVVIGEGERDEAPMLYIGEQVGGGWRRGGAAPRCDIAVDPLEGTNLCATGAPGALAVVALAEDGRFLNSPDTYMEKLAVGPEARGAIDLGESWTWNLERIARAKRRSIDELTVVIQDRPRHEQLIAEVREAGARIRLIADGDISAAIATCKEETGIDALFGTGGAPEGVISAAALRCMGGDMHGRLRFRNDEERERARGMGIADPDRIYTLEDLASGDVVFAATGVTGGSFLAGVRFFGGGASTESVVMRSASGTVRVIDTTRRLERRVSDPPSAPAA